MPYRWRRLVEGPEIGTVMELDAGLRSVRDTARLLSVSTAAVGRALEQGLLPDAFRTPGGHWRIPIADVIALRARRTGEFAVEHPGSAHTSPLRPRRLAGPMTRSAQRRTYILEQLDDQRAVRVSTLSVALGVSEMTIRRDLDRLHADGLAVRAFGGAMRPGPGIESRRGAPEARRDSRSL